MLSIAIVLAAVASPAQVPVRAAAPLQTEVRRLSDEEQLTTLNSVWLNAYVTRDRAALESVLADDFIGIYGEAALSKQQMLDGLAKRRITSVTWKDLRVRVTTDTAVVTAVSAITTGAGTTAVVARYRYADVYARRDGSWRAIASHVVKLPA